MSIPVNKYPINSATPDAHDSTPVWPTNLMWHIPFVRRSNVTASLSVGVIDWGKLVFVSQSVEITCSVGFQNFLVQLVNT